MSDTNLGKSYKKQLMVRHSQRRQCGLLAVLFDPVHISLRSNKWSCYTHAFTVWWYRPKKTNDPLQVLHSVVSLRLTRNAVLLLLPYDLLICFLAYDLSLHGKNACMWRSNQRRTRPLITTCCISRLHCKPDNLLFPIQINGCEPQRPLQIR